MASTSVQFSALALFLMVADTRFTLTQPLRALLATALHPVQTTASPTAASKMTFSKVWKETEERERRVVLTATVPCEVLRAMPPQGGMVLGLAPQKGRDASLNSLFVTVNSQRVDVTDRNVVIASVPRTQVAGAACQRLEITSSEAGTFATFVGLPPTTPTEQAGGQQEDSAQTGYTDLRSGFKDPNLRPGIVGVFTDLTGPAPAGLKVSATIDTRFSTKPTALKLSAMLLAIAATIVAVAALWRLDRADGRRMRRLIPQRWRTFTAVDVTVVGAFAVWYVMGGNSSDDGYILGMARIAGNAGYMSNYFRWFGVPEDPFGWYYNVLALMTHVSTASIWIRLPDLICALICWLLLSREVLPRLGPAVSGSRPALWAAGLVLLAAWMPFDNGLRPEGQIATGALITYVLIERAITSGRLAPAACAIITAAFTLGIQPTGLIAVAALLAGGRPIIRILARRRKIFGTWPLVAPLLAAGTVVGDRAVTEIGGVRLHCAVRNTVQNIEVVAEQVCICSILSCVEHDVESAVHGLAATLVVRVCNKVDVNVVLPCTFFSDHVRTVTDGVLAECFHVVIGDRRQWEECGVSQTQWEVRLWAREGDGEGQVVNDLETSQVRVLFVAEALDCIEEVAVELCVAEQRTVFPCLHE